MPPPVFLTNDDGIAAPGLAALIAALAPNFDLTVVAPETEKSATSHAINFFRPCRLTPHPERVPGGRAWALDGNPADCTKCGLTMFYPDGPPALDLPQLGAEPHEVLPRPGRNLLGVQS